ncbi:MAG: MmgE/PrpD family protein [Deltaproteobacteria bacterium]|nr:MmgE/PrpD family protein [Deltaproteobacteria bacterium]
MKYISEQYAEFIQDVQYDRLEPETIRQAKQLILDLMGVSLAGYKLMEFPRMVVDYMAGLGGISEATIIQQKRKFPAINAALANAACAHALDMDDGHRYGALHPGTVIIPAAIAAAELSNTSTKRMISGVVAGYEVMIRTGMAITPSSLNRGFHITGITGTYGAAAAVANIMNLNREQTMAALGLAGLQSSGLIQVNHEKEGAKVKPINPGKAAMSGLLSCVMASKGFSGPKEIFEGEDGFLKAVADVVNEEYFDFTIARKLEINNVYLKLYSACRHAHAPIDAVLEIQERDGIEPNEIKAITVETYPAAVRLAGMTEVTSPSAGRFSIPFSVALALLKKDAGATQYTEENIEDRQIQDLAGKVRLLESDKWGRAYPHKRGATVRIICNDSKEYFTEIDLAKGEPENPASWDEIYNKFYANARLLLSEEKVVKLGDTILDLENQPLQAMVDLI